MNTFLLYHNRKWEIPDNMLWKESAWKQDIFIRDNTICRGLLDNTLPFVISSHRSKSIVLPVYGFIMRNGVKVICRDNFYDWKISVELPAPLPKDYIPSELISDGDASEGQKKIPDCYLEGFKDEWSYDAYDRNSDTQTKFTIEVYGDHRFWTIMFFLKRAFPNIVIDSSTDNRSISDIVKSIQAIYDANGVNEFSEEYEKKLGYRSSYMSGWELLNNTHRIADDKKYDDDFISKRYEKNEKGWYPITGTDIFDDPILVAELIKEYPEVHSEFLMEEKMFNTEF